MSSSSSSPTSSLPSAGPRSSSPTVEEDDAICKSDYIHNRGGGRSGECQQPTASAFTTLAPQSTTSTPPSFTFVTAATAASSDPSFTTSTAGTSWDAETLRRADEEFVLGLFGVQRPDNAAVQQRRQQLGTDQQTASQFAGADGRESAINDAGVVESKQHRRNKTETKAEARNDRSQGRFDQSGQRISSMSASQSVKEMEKQAEHNRKAEQQRRKVSEHEKGSKQDETNKQQQQQQAHPRPLDDRRPVGETKDSSAPWSE